MTNRACSLTRTHQGPGSHHSNQLGPTASCCSNQLGPTTATGACCCTVTRACSLTRTHQGLEGHALHSPNSTNKAQSHCLLTNTVLTNPPCRNMCWHCTRHSQHTCMPLPALVPTAGAVAASGCCHARSSHCSKHHHFDTAQWFKITAITSACTGTWRWAPQVLHLSGAQASIALGTPGTLAGGLQHRHHDTMASWPLCTPGPKEQEVHRHTQASTHRVSGWCTRNLPGPATQAP